MNNPTKIIPLYWEPVNGSGERFAVGAIININNTINVVRLIRDDVIDILYGEKSDGVKSLISTSLELHKEFFSLVGTKDGISNSIMGITSGSHIEVFVDNAFDAAKTSALLFSSLANIDAIGEAENDVAQNAVEKRNTYFSTQIKEFVINKKPEFNPCFNRQASIIGEGKPISFGFLSDTLILHFGTLSPLSQSAGVRTARAKLWELVNAKELLEQSHFSSGLLNNTSQINAGLIIGHASFDDPTLTDNQISNMQENLAEIESEADNKKMRLYKVASAYDGANELIKLAS